MWAGTTSSSVPRRAMFRRRSRCSSTRSSSSRSRWASPSSTRNAFTNSVSQAIQAGISVVIYNTADPQGMANVKAATGVMPGYVGQEFIGAGKINGFNAAKFAQQYTGRKDGKIIMQNIQPGHFALETRAKGTEMGVQE